MSRSRHAFPFETNGRNRVLIERTGELTRVQVDGAEVLKFGSVADLKAGTSRKLADGTTLSVRLRSNILWWALEVHRDDEPLPGSLDHPHRAIELAGNVLYFFAGLQALVALVLIAAADAPPAKLIELVPELVSGVGFALAGLITHRRSPGGPVLGLLVGVARTVVVGIPNMGLCYGIPLFVVLLRGFLGALRARREAPRASGKWSGS